MDGCLSVRTSWMAVYQFTLHGWLSISSHFMDGCLSVRTSWMAVYQFALHGWLSISSHFMDGCLSVRTSWMAGCLSISSHFMDGWLSVYQFTILLRVHVETKTLVQQQQQLSSHGPWKTIAIALPYSSISSLTYNTILSLLAVTCTICK